MKLKKTDLERIKKLAKKNKNEFILIELKTKKQEGDIAGSKLLKFYNYLSREIEKYFVIKNKGFNYSGGKEAKCFFVVKTHKEILFSGPNLKDEVNVKRFRKKHGKNIFVKKGKVYFRKKVSFGIREFVNSLVKKNKKQIREMYLSGVGIVD